MTLEETRRKKQWVEQQTAFLRALEGQRVLRWHGIEEALGTGSNGLPNWLDASAGLVQLLRLSLMLTDETGITIETCQTGKYGERFGLCGYDALPPPSADTDLGSIFRLCPLDEMPTGRIEGVAVTTDEGDIAEVRLQIAGHEVRLWAGEVYEQNDGSWLVMTMDECVLLQVDGGRP